jgi:hypothetical protein
LPFTVTSIGVSIARSTAAAKTETYRRDTSHAALIAGEWLAPEEWARHAHLKAGDAAIHRRYCSVEAL